MNTRNVILGLLVFWVLVFYAVCCSSPVAPTEPIGNDSIVVDTGLVPALPCHKCHFEYKWGLKEFEDQK